MNHTRLLAQIKLRETQRQRDRLQQHYNAIEERVARAGSPLERLRALLEALGTFRFLLTELVPLQLILENRGVEAEADTDPVPLLPAPVADRLPRTGLAGDSIPF